MNYLWSSEFAKIRVFKVDCFVLPLFLAAKLRSVEQIEWKKPPIYMCFPWASSWFQSYQILALCFQSPPAWLVHQMKAFGGDFSTATNKWYIVGCTLHELILPSDSAVSDMSKAPVIWSFFFLFLFCGHNWFIITSLSFRKCIYGTLFYIKESTLGPKPFYVSFLISTWLWFFSRFF